MNWLEFEREVPTGYVRTGYQHIARRCQDSISRETYARLKCLECKFNQSSHVAYIKRAKLEKTIQDAEAKGKLPVLAFKLEGDTQVYVVLRLEDFTKLVKVHKSVEVMKNIIMVAMLEYIEANETTTTKKVSRLNHAEDAAFHTRRI